MNTTSPLLVIRIIGGQLIPTHRTRIMQFQPRQNTIRMVNVLTWHLLGLLTELEGVLVDGTLR